MIGELVDSVYKKISGDSPCSRRQDACLYLSEARYNTTGEILIRGVFDAKVVRVYDARTVWVAICMRPDQKGDSANGPIRFSSQKEPYGIGRVCCRLLDIPALDLGVNEMCISEHRRTQENRARYRLAQLLTNCRLPKTYSEQEYGSCYSLQRALDTNTAVLENGLQLLHPSMRDASGRYLARLKTVDGLDAASQLLEEGYFA